jgi:hypothetical protein
MDKEIERIKTTQEDISDNTKEMDNVVDNTEHSKEVQSKKDNSIDGDTQNKAVDSTVENTQEEAKPKHGEKYNHPGSNNLIPQSEKTKEEQRRIASMGGKASQEKRRARKTAREIAQAMLQAKLSEDTIDKYLGEDKALLDGNTDAYAVLIAKMIQTTLEKGDSKAATFVRDTAGDKPDENMNVATVFTEGDKALMEKLSKRLGMGEN